MTKFNKYLSNFKVDEIIELDQQGLNSKQIASLLSIPSRRFSEMIKYFDIKTENFRQTVSKNQTFFDVIDTEEKAYILGYTVADGSVSIEPKKRKGLIYSYSKRLSYLTSVDDLEVIERIRNAISSKTNLKFLCNNSGAKSRKEQVSLRFSSTILVDSLIKLGIKPRKTYDNNFKFNFDVIPNNLIRHFVRGLIDGDGNVTEYSLGLVGTSINFLIQIKEQIEKEIGPVIMSYSISQGKTVEYYKMSISLGYDIRFKIYEYLYKDSTIFLERKRVKFYDWEYRANRRIKKPTTV